MKQLSCLIVEDEPLAAEVLQDYIEQLPQLRLVAVCTDALYALGVLQKEVVDVIFLDIHLPKLKGLDFLKSLTNPPQVIITTAYHQYAVQGYEFNVVDFLLKPIEFSRFLQAVNKLGTNEKNTKRQKETKRLPHERDYRFFTVNKHKVKVYLDDILYIESLKEYVRIVTPQQRILTKFQIGEIASLLPDEQFVRVHRSYIVAIHKISAFSNVEVVIGEKLIPIGRSYKEMVAQCLNSL